GAVAPAPERIADHHNILFARRFFLGGKSAAALRRCAEEREEVRRDQCAAEALRFGVACEIPLRRRQGGYGLEGSVRLTPLKVILDAHGQTRKSVLSWQYRLDAKDAVRCWIRERLQQYGINHAKNSGVRADAEGKGGDGGSGKARALS